MEDTKKKSVQNTTTKKRLSGKTKAAIFSVAVGPDISSHIFKYLKEDEIEQLVFEIARINKVEPSDKERVLVEFQELMMAQDFITAGGVDYARDVLEKALGSQAALDIINKLTSSLQVRPFDFIRKADPTHLANFIQQEHPQTIALVLAYLDAKKAAAILATIDPDKRVDVARRIATMDRISPEILREVERVLERKISTIANEDFTAAGGVDSIVEILNNVDRSTERSIMESLEEEDPELAEEVKKKMFIFEDIVLLDDKSIQRLLREVDNQELARALKAVDPEVQEKIFKNMSKRASQTLKEDIEFMGPLRIKEVEEVQQKIVGIIKKLEEKGEIIIARSGEEDMLV